LIYWLPDYKIVSKNIMIKIFPLIILFSVMLFPQQNNLLNLYNDIKDIHAEDIGYNAPVQFNKKNAGLAILLSMLVPGMGELYAGNYSTGKYLTIAEGALWLTYIGIDTYGGWQEKRYKALAVSRGGINPEGKDEIYYATISAYFNIDEYNDEQALNRNFDEMYNRDEYYWNWQNTDDRRSYRSMWVSSEQAYNNLRFVVGGLIVNRLISVINAVRTVSAHNRRLTEETWNVSVSYSPDLLNPGVRLNLVTLF
jgi:hypothetical protein